MRRPVAGSVASEPRTYLPGKRARQGGGSHETKDAYVFKADLPGMKQEEVQPRRIEIGKGEGGAKAGRVRSVSMGFAIRGEES